MEAAARAFFLYAEAPLTGFAGVYALRAPMAFLVPLLPARLRGPANAFSPEQVEVVSFVVQIYGLVLLLLALAEFGILKVRQEIYTKRALILSMLIADVIHVAVFLRLFLFSPSGQLLPLGPTISAWDTQEWVSVASNAVLVAIMMVARLGWLATAKPGAKLKAA